MKNIFTFLLGCLSASALIAQNSATRITMLSSTVTETVLQVDLNGVSQHPVQTPVGTAMVVSIQEGTPLLQKGAPDLPKLTATLAIPNAGKMAFEVIKSSYTDYPNVVVAPSKGDLKRNIDPATIPYEYGAAFHQDAFFPGALVALQQPFVLRDVRGQAAWLQPVQYNATTNLLRVYTSLTIRIFQTSTPGEQEIAPDKKPFPSRAFQQLYQKTFLNYDGKTGARGIGEPDKMLVIAADALIPELEPLVVWKRQMGIQTTVVPISEIGSGAADDVYQFVQHFYHDHGITYLFLVGDEHLIEPLTRADGAPYSCDNCFGYMDDADHFPEIFVGRFHASSPEQLRVMVNRNLEYEKTPLVDPAQNWCATGMASTSDQGAGFGDDNQADYEQGNEWKTKHLADGFEKYWEFYDGNQSAISPTPGNETADQQGNPISSDLLALLNGRGASLYNYTGHGWEQGLASGNFSVDAVAAMRNDHRYPICIAVACCAGNFTNNGSGDCLGEAFQRAGDLATGAPWGGIAGYFSSDFQSWSPPMEGQDGMNELLESADGITTIPTVGSMLAYGNAKMIASYAEGGEIMADFWNVFGEPSTIPHTKLPQTLTAVHPAGLFIGTTSVSVSCAVEGALVSLYWQSQTLATATVVGGVAELQFPALNTVGNLTVTVTQFNYIPYQGQIQVTPSSGPYVVYESMTLHDDIGNGNQLADYGEHITMDVFIGNVGDAMANDVQTTLSTTDPNVVITDGVGSTATIASGVSLLQYGVFAFSVNDDVEDGHIVDFKLTTTYNGTYTTETIIPVKLQAPHLAIGTLSIDDSPTGGNNNKRLDSQETPLIIVKNHNPGHSISPDAFGILTSTSPWITLIGPAIPIGQLAALGAGADASFYVEVDPNFDAPQSGMVDFVYTVIAGHYTATTTFHLSINALIADFEPGNSNTFYWSTTGQAWVVSSENPYEGSYCTHSGLIVENQKSTRNTSVNVVADDIISFARKVESESGYDFLRFYIDNEVVGEWSGDLPWEEVSFPISQGFHLLAWSYEKDEIVSYGLDRAWVDEIVFPPLAPIVGTQQPTPGLLATSIVPNPAGTETSLSFNLMSAQSVYITLLDCLGRPVHSIQNTLVLPAGNHTQRVVLDGLATGVYFVYIQTESGTSLERIVKI